MVKIMEILKNIEVDADFENSKDFVSDRLLDSLDIMTLVEELETEFDIEVLGSDIIPENFSTVDSIKELVRKSGGNM